MLLGAAAPRLLAQSDDFNDGNDAGWTHYSLPNFPPNTPPFYLPPPGYYGAATFSFPDDGSGGKAYKISAPGITNDPLSILNARAGSFRTDGSYAGRFSVGTDFLQWNAIWRQEAGLLFYFQDVGLGTSDGYAATYSSAYKTMYLSVLFDEAPVTVGQLADGSVVLDPTHRYRLVVSSHDGYTHLFQLFDKAEPDSPWTSVIGQDATYNAGLCGIFVYQQNLPPSPMGAEATFDNYLAAVPPQGTLLATVTDLSPPPAGKATALYPTITVGILDRDTSVDTSSIVLCLDGVWIPNAALTIDPQVHRPNNPSGFPKDFNGATVTYAITTLYPWGSRHTNQVAFRDFSSNWQTNTWTWTTAYPYLFASNSLPIGSLSARGFDARMVQSDNGGVNLDNSLERALQQLAIPPQIPLDRTATSIVQVLNWDKTTAPPGNVPGLCAGSYRNIALELFAYLELSAGPHRFHIITDDGAGLYSGRRLSDPAAQVLWEKSSGTANTTFDFVVEADGLYPVRCLWQETGGAANLRLWSVNLGDASEVLVNDPANPTGVVKAWYPLVCLSAASVAGPYSVDAPAVNALNTTDLVGADCAPTVVGAMVTGGKFTVPITGATRFYRLDGPRQTRIIHIEKVGANIEITYQVQ